MGGCPRSLVLVVAALVVSVCPIWMCSHGMVDGIRIFYETNDKNINCGEDLNL